MRRFNIDLSYIKKLETISTDNKGTRIFRMGVNNPHNKTKKFKFNINNEEKLKILRRFN